MLAPASPADEVVPRMYRLHLLRNTSLPIRAACAGWGSPVVRCDGRSARMSRMRVLVTGAGGQLGRDVATAFESSPSGHEVIAADHSTLDVSERDAVLGTI